MIRKIVFLSFIILLISYNFANADWPVVGTWPDEIESDFGPRGTTGFHEGLDFAVPVHTPVKAVRSGYINLDFPPGWENPDNHSQGYGFRIYIGNDVYGHLEPDLGFLTQDQIDGIEIIPAGQQIAWSGNTGHSTGSHLHFEISPGNINPLRILSYTPGTPSIESTELTGNVTKVDDKDYVNGEVRLDAYIETIKKDLNVIKFEISPNPSGSGFPAEYNYETNKLNLPSGMIYNSYTDASIPAQDHFYFDFDTTGWPDGQYTLTVTAKDINNNQVEEVHEFEIDNYPYLEEVSVNGIEAAGSYNAHWKNVSDTERNLDVEDFEVFRPGEVGVSLRFSEKMDVAYSPVVVMEVNETNISVEDTQGWVSDDTWQGRCTLPEEEGEVHIRVSGVVDLSGNEIDGEPETIAYLDENGDWHDHLPNVDGNHWFYLTYKRIIMAGQMKNFVTGAYSRIMKAWDEEFTGYEKPEWNQFFTGSEIQAGKDECKNFWLSVSIHDANITESTRFKFNLLESGGGVVWEYEEYPLEGDHGIYNFGLRGFQCWITMYDENRRVIGGGEKDVYHSFKQDWACETNLKHRMYREYDVYYHLYITKKENPNFVPRNGILTSEIDPYEIARLQGINPQEVAYWDIGLDMWSMTAGFWSNGCSSEGYEICVNGSCGGCFNYYDTTWLKYGIEGLEDILKGLRQPGVKAVFPANNAYVRSPDIGVVEIKFSEDVEAPEGNWGQGVIITKSKSGEKVKGTFLYDEKSRILSFSGDWEDHIEYKIEVNDNIFDREGNPVQKFTSIFHTAMLKEKGGKVISENVILDVPADALPVDGVINITKEQGEILKRVVKPIEPWEDHFYNILLYDINHSEVKKDFSKEATLTISYQNNTNPDSRSSTLSNPDFRKAFLDIYHYSEGGNRWVLEKKSERLLQEGELQTAILSSGKYGLMGFVRPSGALNDLSNFPNPFAAGREKTTIQYFLQKDSDVIIAIYDLMGNLVKTFKIDKGDEGGQGGKYNEIDWVGKNGQGYVVANGGYICRVEIDDGAMKEHKIRKILVVK